MRRRPAIDLRQQVVEVALQRCAGRAVSAGDRGAVRRPGGEAELVQDFGRAGDPAEPMVRLLAAVEEATPRLTALPAALELESPDRLCSAVFNCASVWTWPVAVPKLIFWAAPPLTATDSELPEVKPPWPLRVGTGRSKRRSQP